MTTLQGKVAIVTGASRGVGKGIAAELARCGARVFSRTSTGLPILTARLHARLPLLMSERRRLSGGRSAGDVRALAAPTVFFQPLREQ